MTDFFATLYEGAIDDDGDTLTAGEIVIWDGKTKGSTWHRSVTGAHRAAEAVSGAGHEDSRIALLAAFRAGDSVRPACGHVLRGAARP